MINSKPTAKYYIDNNWDRLQKLEFKHITEELLINC